MKSSYWYVSEGDQIEYQIRSRDEDRAPWYSGRVTEIGTVLGAPYFRVDDGAGVYLLSDLRDFRNLSAVAS
jgi:hypothetical protein